MNKIPFPTSPKSHKKDLGDDKKERSWVSNKSIYPTFARKRSGRSECRTTEIATMKYRNEAISGTQ
jgi:hypothetical protein